MHQDKLKLINFVTTTRHQYLLENVNINCHKEELKSNRTTTTLITSEHLWNLIKKKSELSVAFMFGLVVISHIAFKMSELIVAYRNVFGIVAVYSILMIGVNGGSCREATLCCNGRDSSCVVQKAPINAIIEDLNDKPCYCDHACLKLGDCCEDFKQHCGGEFYTQIFNEFYFIHK